ncbi:MAG: phage major capsid protein [Gordonia polyisoprenivorans]|nr:phage major capsid protein [Gordonia polyisoprenivorans]
MLTSNSKPLAPAEISELIVEPAFAQATAASAATVIPFTTNELRVPVVTDGSAAWVAEGNEIPVDEPTLAEVVVTPKKLAVVVALTNELVADANGDITKIVGDSVTRAIARKLDAAFWAATTPPNGLKAIGSVTGVLTGTVAADPPNLDAFTDAVADLAARGHTATAIAVSPNTFRKLAKMKSATGSNHALLQPDATAPTPLQIAGLPVIVTSALADTVAYVVNSSAIVLGIRTTDVEIAVDRSAFFTSDRVALRAVLRVGTAFPAPDAIVKIAIS